MANDLIPISAVTSAPTKAPDAPAASNTLDKDAFLKLLVAQLKYQNPMSPADPNQFMAQTAQFTMVEKLTSLDDSVSKQALVERNLSAVGLIGRQIEWQTDDGARHTGTVDAAQLTADGPLLQVGQEQVPFSSIVRITQASTQPSA